MSNNIYIQQIEHTVRHTGKVSHKVAVFDDDGYDHVNIEDLRDCEANNFIDDELFLFRQVVACAYDGYKTISAIIDFVCEHKKGVCIEGQWYSWEQIKPILIEEEMYEEETCEGCKGNPYCQLEAFQDCQHNPANKDDDDPNFCPNLV